MDRGANGRDMEGGGGSQPCPLQGAGPIHNANCDMSGLSIIVSALGGMFARRMASAPPLY